MGLNWEWLLYIYKIWSRSISSIQLLYNCFPPQGLIEEIQSVQEEITRLQTSFTEDLASNAVDSDMADQLAMQSSLAVLAERMATIHMKASGKQQLLEVKIVKIYYY